MRGKRKKQINSVEDFWVNVDKSAGDDGCWLWTGYIRPGRGYGGFSLTKVCGKETNTHRISFWLAKGRAPTMFVLHHCDVRACVNPKHLYEGTALQNAQDRVKRGRSGHLHPDWYQKIAFRFQIKSAETVIAIKKALADGKRICDIVKETGIKRSTIDNIKLGRAYARIS